MTNFHIAVDYIQMGICKGTSYMISIAMSTFCTDLCCQTTQFHFNFQDKRENISVTIQHLLKSS